MPPDRDTEGRRVWANSMILQQVLKMGIVGNRDLLEGLKALHITNKDIGEWKEQSRQWHCIESEGDGLAHSGLWETMLTIKQAGSPSRYVGSDDIALDSVRETPLLSGNTEPIRALHQQLQRPGKLWNRDVELQAL